MGGVKETAFRISNFISSKNRLLSIFGIEEDFFVKPSLDKCWEITEAEDFLVVRHGADEDSMQSCVIVRKDNKPMLARKSNYTAVVALDVVRVCFVFDNSKYIGKTPQKTFG